MDDVSETSWKQLPYIDVRVDEVEPRQGVLDLVRRLRPKWKLQDVQMKASSVMFAVWICQIWGFIFDNLGVFVLHVLKNLSLFLSTREKTQKTLG